MNQEQKQQLQSVNQRLATALKNLENAIDNKPSNQFEQNNNQSEIKKIKQENLDLTHKVEHLNSDNDNIKKNSKIIINEIKNELTSIKKTINS
jgi:hypothetical protein